MDWIIDQFLLQIGQKKHYQQRYNIILDFVSEIIDFYLTLKIRGQCFKYWKWLSGSDEQNVELKAFLVCDANKDGALTWDEVEECEVRI